MYRRTQLATGVAVLLITACGGGGGDSETAPVNTTDQAGSTGIERPTDDVPDATDRPPTADETVALSDLYGQFSISFAFTGSEETVFTVATSWGAENVGTTPQGTDYLQAPQTDRTMTRGSETPLVGRSQSLLCNVSNAARTNFACTIDSGSSVNLTVFFGGLSNGRSQGFFYLCDESAEDATNCDRSAVPNVDGQAGIRVATPPAAVIAQTGPSTDLTPYMQYARQGVPGIALTGVDAQALADAVAATHRLREAVKP